MRIGKITILLMLMAGCVQPADGGKLSADVSAQLSHKTNSVYDALDKKLAEYKQIQSDGGWKIFPAGAALRLGDVDKRVPILREELAKMGDFSKEDKLSEKYDEDLKLAVLSFQRRHGLKEDGVISNKTQQALAIPVEVRITQIEQNLKRIQDFFKTRNDSERYILVNVAGYYLKVREQGKDVFGMKVIVGNPTNHTPLFSKVVDVVVINPTWSVPARIASKEILPKARKDPNYLIKSGYQLYDFDGERVDLANADLNENYMIKQPAGKGNALGKFKFNIPDSDSIYLHDTARPKLFAENFRSLSHGCIRLEQPEKLANFLLKGEGWQDDKIQKSFQSSVTRSIRINPVKVDLVYWTSFVGDDGKIYFQPDIYGLD